MHGAIGVRICGDDISAVAIWRVTARSSIHSEAEMNNMNTESIISLDK